ncbi:30S ribosomal protein S1 [bacterium HR34]|nr:30S ribosomal protein S1 [bacterium HR34]
MQQKTQIKQDDIKIKVPKVGDIIDAVYLGNDGLYAFFDIYGFKTGVIFGKEFLDAKNVIENLKKGDTVKVRVIELENEEGFVELSMKEAGKELNWKTLKELKEKGEVIKVKIEKANKGGLITTISNIQAFLPVSQLSIDHYPRVGSDPQKILKELQKFVGKEMEVRILDIDPKEDKLILSEKEKESETLKKIVSNYKEGEIVEGEITAVVDFGAFIKFSKDNIKPIEGLIHISELDWKLIEDPSEIVKKGDRIKAKIVKIENDRVFLSLKQLKENPWEKIKSKYKKGDVVKGKVKRVANFGAFIELSPDIQGLCHISVFGSKEELLKHLNLEKEYEFVISEFNPDNYRIILIPKFLVDQQKETQKQ